MNTRRYRAFTVGYWILILLVSTIPAHALVHSSGQQPLGVVCLILSAGILCIDDWLADLFGVLTGGTIGLVIVNLRLQRKWASHTGV